MKVEQLIKEHFDEIPEPKRFAFQLLHNLILAEFPKCLIWFNDGKDKEGKVIANPNIGYGYYNIKYANNQSRDFYRIGLSSNKTGISVYILGIGDKNYLARNYKTRIGKATISGYCIKFRQLADINIPVLLDAIKYGMSLSS